MSRAQEIFRQMRAASEAASPTTETPNTTAALTKYGAPTASIAGTVSNSHRLEKMLQESRNRLDQKGTLDIGDPRVAAGQRKEEMNKYSSLLSQMEQEDAEKAKQYKLGFAETVENIIRSTALGGAADTAYFGGSALQEAGKAAGAFLDGSVGMNARSRLGKDAMSNEQLAQAGWVNFGGNEDLADLVRSKTQAAGQSIKDIASRGAEKAETYMAGATAGKSGIGKFAVEAGAGLAGIGADIISPLGATANMFTRVAGAGTREAEQNGADSTAALVAGVAKGALASKIEKLMGGAFRKVYGAGATDEMAEALIRRLAKTDKGRTAIRFLVNSAGEGAEEFVEGALEPVLNAIYDEGQELGGIYSSWDNWADAFAENMRSALVGAAVGAVGAAGNIVTGGNRASNAELRALDKADAEAKFKAEYDAAVKNREKYAADKFMYEQLKTIGVIKEVPAEYSADVDEKYPLPSRSAPNSKSAEISPERSESKQGLSDELNSTPKSKGLYTYSRSVNKHGYNVRQKGAEAELPDVDVPDAYYSIDDQRKAVDKYYSDESNEEREAIYDILGNKSMSAEEKLLLLQQLQEEYGSNHEWRIDEHGEVVDAANVKPTRFDEEEFLASDVNYVVEPTVKYSSREEPAAGVGTKVTNEMREADKRRSDELAEREKYRSIPPPKEGYPSLKEVMDKYSGKNSDRVDEVLGIIGAISNGNKQQPLQSKPEGAKVEEKQQSNTDIALEAARKGVNSNGRETDARTGHTAEAGERRADERLRDNSASRNISRGAQSVPELARRSSGEVGFSDTSKDNFGGLAGLTGETDLPNNRRGRDVSGKQESWGKFGENTYEIIKPNKRDTGFINWAKRESGMNVRAFAGTLEANGDTPNALHIPSINEILVIIGGRKGEVGVVHEVLHEKFRRADVAAKKKINATEALASLENRLTDSKKDALESIKKTVRKKYFDRAVSSVKELAKSELGWDEGKIEAESNAINAAAERVVKEEVMVHIATGYGEGNTGKRIELLRDDARKVLIEQGVVSESFFDSIPYTKKQKAPKTHEQVIDGIIKEAAGVKQTEGVTPESDDDLPFSVGEEPVSEAKSVDEPAGKKPSPKEIAKSAFGAQYEAVAENAGRVEQLKMFNSTEAFSKRAGKREVVAADTATGEYKKAVRDFVNGHKSPKELADYFKSIKDNPYVGLFRSDRIDYMLDRLASDYEAASADGASRIEQARYQHTATAVMKTIARRAELANDAITNRELIHDSLKKHAPKKKLGWLGGGYLRLTVNAPNMFRAVDGFDKKADGIGYATADATEDAAAVSNIEKVNGWSFFSDVKTNKKASDLLRGKTMTGVKLGDTELNELQAISLISMYDTLKATSKKKLDGLESIQIPGKNGDTVFNFGKDEDVDESLRKLTAELRSKLSPEAKAYMAAQNKMFSYYKPKLRDTSEDVNGTSITLFEDGKYFPVRYANSDVDSMLSDSIENADFDGSLATPAMTHRRSSESGAVLVLEPASEVIARYINQASNYIAYAGLAQRLELMNMASGTSPSISQSFRDTYGDQFGEWAENYVEDIQLVKSNNGDSADQANSFLRRARHNLQQGALLFSPSTPIKQGAAYFSAMGILRPSSLVKAWNFNPIKGRGESSGNYMAEGRKLGGLDPDVRDLLHQSDTWLGKLKGMDNGFSKFVKMAADSIGARDAKIVDDLYHACVLDVAADEPQLDRNSKHFKELVESKFEEVILRAQSTSERAISSELQRTDNELIRFVSMFRSQQTQEFNKIIKAVGEWKASKSKEDAATLKKTVAGQVASAVHFSILTGLVNLALHRLDRYEDEDKKFSIEKFATSVLIDSAETLAGVAWLGDAAAQYIIEKASDGEYNEFYGIPLGPIDTVLDLMDSIEWFMQSKTVPNAKRVAGYVGNLFGVPVNNVYYTLNALAMWGIDLLGENPGDYDELTKFFQSNIDAKATDELRYGALSDNAEAELRRVFSETNKTALFLPERKAGDSFSYDGEDFKLNKTEAKDMANNQSKVYSDYIDMLISESYYKDASNSAKAKMIEEAKDYALDAAKEELIEGRGSVYSSKYTEMRDEYGEANAKRYAAISGAYNAAETIKDYDVIDDIISAANKLPSNLQEDFKDSVGKSKYEAVSAGVSSKTYAEYSKKKSAGYDAFEALFAVNMDSKERNVLADATLSGAKKDIYNAAVHHSYPQNQIPDLFDLLTGGDGNISQKDLKEAYKLRPEIEALIEEVWGSKYPDKSWDAYK